MFRFFYKNIADMENSEILKVSRTMRAIEKECKGLEAILNETASNPSKRNSSTDKRLKSRLRRILRMFHSGDELTKKAIIEELTRKKTYEKAPDDQSIDRISLDVLRKVRKSS